MEFQRYPRKTELYSNQHFFSPASYETIRDEANNLIKTFEDEDYCWARKRFCVACWWQLFRGKVCL